MHFELEQPGNEVPVEPAASIATGSLLLGGMSEERLLFAVDLVLAGVKVGLVGLDHLGLHDELVTENAY